jgi:hypothetical protein
MNDNSSQLVDYRTHILIGSTSSGKLSVVYHWPHLPRQDEVQQKIDASQEGYATFLLCTPTSIMPSKGNRFVMGKQGSSRPFRPRTKRAMCAQAAT